MDSLAGQIAKDTILVFLAGRPDSSQETLYGVLGSTCHANSGANRIALHEGRDYLGLFGYC